MYLFNIVFFSNRHVQEQEQCENRDGYIGRSMYVREHLSQCSHVLMPQDSHQSVAQRPICFLVK